MSNAVKLPLLTDQGATPHYDFQCELDGATYSFEFVWNDRDGFWYMEVGDAEENLLAGEIRVVLGKILLARFKGANYPPGLLICKDTSGQDVDPGLVDLGTRVEIWYYPAT